MSKTSDNDKKAKDNQAKHEQKNMQEQKSRQAGQHSYSKEVDHL
nr:DUF3941 domain-containing protein [Bacillus sp. CGMCC 1.16541]